PALCAAPKPEVSRAAPNSGLSIPKPGVPLRPWESRYGQTRSLYLTLSRSLAARPPRLHDSLVGHELDVSSRDVPTEECEGASHFTTDLCGLVSDVHGLHDSTELYHLVELFGVGERFVNALPARFEDRFLVNGFRRMRNPVLGFRPSLSCAQGQSAECDSNPDHRLPPRGPIGERCQIISIAHHCHRHCHRPPEFLAFHRQRITTLRENMFNIIFSWPLNPLSRHTSVRLKIKEASCLIPLVIARP